MNEVTGYDMVYVVAQGGGTKGKTGQVVALDAATRGISDAGSERSVCFKTCDT